MSASGSYLHTEAPDFSNSDLDAFMNPMLRQAAPPNMAPNMIGLNNPAFMGQQPGGPQQHMGNPNGPAPMGMLQGNPDMRFPPGHNPAMGPGRMMMRPGGRPPMTSGGMPAHLAGLGHNPQMQPGMGFSPNMMPGPGGMAVRRAVSNPALNPGLGGQMMHQQMQNHPQIHHQQMVMAARQQQHNAQQQRQAQQMELAMMGRQPGNPQNAGLVRAPSTGQQQHLMNSLSQPTSLNQPSHPGGMPHNGFQNPVAPPPQSSSPRSRTPVMAMSQGPSHPSHPPINRAQMSSEDMFVFQQNQQYPPRNMGINGQFTFGTSPTPPLNMPDSFPPPGGTPRSGAFPPTPAQQLMQQHGGAAENGYPFGMAPPQRPLSNNQHPTLQQQHSPPQQSQHHSPHHSDHMNPHPPRPQSQPQPQPPPGRPLSGAGPSHGTPRPAQQPGLPNNAGLLPPGRLPPQQQHPNLRPQSSGSSSHPQPIAPRPPPPTQAPAPTSSDGTLMSASASPPDANAMLSSIPRPPPTTAQTYSLGYGQGLIRVMQFSGLLSSDTPQIQSQKLQLTYWDDLIREYFTPKAIMKLTLWRDSMKNEAKPFEIGVPILPRFFLVTTQSGVKSMSLTLDGARERVYAPGHAVVECVTAVWTYRYNNGHIVTLRGPLTAHLVICSPAPHPQPGAIQNRGAPPYILKFDDFEFDAHSHDKYIALESIAGPRKTEEPPPTVNGPGLADEEKKWEEPRLLIENGSIPGEPVNAFGIPQATMRCLELAESVGQMADLISFAKEQDVGPLSALKSFADKIREEQPGLSTAMNGFGANPYFQGSAIPSAQGNTLYSSAPPSVTNPASAQPSSSMSSPQNAPPSAHNSPQKQHKTIPSKSTVASASTPSTTSSNTPAMANATLKRKTEAPAAPEPPAKRPTRRRRTTGGGG